MPPYTGRVALCIVVSVACAIATRAVHRNLRAGWPRVLALSPFTLLLLLLPTLFDHNTEVLSLCVTAALFGWWASWKVVLMAFGRATLPRTASTPSYVALLLLPVLLPPPPLAPLPQQPAGTELRAGQKLTSLRTLLLRCSVKLVTLRVVCGVMLLPFMANRSAAQLDASYAARLLQLYAPATLARNVMYALGLYCFLGAMMDVLCAAASGFLGVSLAPHFGDPLRSASLSEFWAQRWNLFAAGLLRRIVYDPIVDGRLLGSDVDNAPLGGAAAAQRAIGGGRQQHPPARRRAVGVCATFLASGVAHEARHQSIDDPDTRPRTRFVPCTFILTSQSRSFCTRRRAPARRSSGCRSSRCRAPRCCWRPQSRGGGARACIPPVWRPFCARSAFCWPSLQHCFSRRSRRTRSTNGSSRPF